MKKTFLESSVLFASVGKWVVLASGVGLVVGFSTTVFLKLLGLAVTSASAYGYYYLLLPLALPLSVLLVRKLAPEAEGHGTERVIEAVHKRSGKIPALVVPVKLAATIATIALGGSAGKEGPCAQIGAGLSSVLADLFRFNDRDRKKLVICGISAGFSTVFGTPIAGALFGVEVLFVGGLLYEVLLPSFVAGIVGYQVSSALGVAYFHEPLSFVPVFSSFLFLKVCLSGVFFGLCSLLLVESLNYFKRLSAGLSLGPYWRAALGGLVLSVLAYLLSTRYLGLGLDTIQTALEGGEVPPLAFALKTLFTSITLNFGGSGGIVTPIFFVGASAGNMMGGFLGLDPALLAAIGMVSLLAGAANTPISASIMAVEIFGPTVAPYASVACIISFLMTGHRSVYPSQILSISKSGSFDASGKGKEMKDVGPVRLEPGAEDLLGGLSKTGRKIIGAKPKDEER